MNDSPSTARTPGVERRTLVAGAAWTIPVVATAVGAPLAAASAALQVAFDRPEYSGTACGTIDGASVSVTRDGATAPSEQVTVTLAGGYTFVGGGATRILTSGPDGTAALPPIAVPGSGGQAVVTAAITGASASAGLTSLSNGRAFQYRTGSDTRMDEYPAVPSDATPLGSGFYLARNGDVYYANSIVASGVARAATYSSQGFNVVNYVTTTGRVFQYRTGSDTRVDEYPAIPGDATPVGSGYFLTPNGTLYYANSVVASNVAEAATASTQGFNVANYTTTTGRAFQYRVGSDVRLDEYPAVPAGSTPLGSSYYLAPNGDVYYANSVIASGVTKAATYSTQGFNIVNYITSDGRVFQYRVGSDTQRDEFTAVPSDATPIGSAFFLAPNGDLYYGNGVIATDVAEAATASTQGFNTVNFITTPPCS
ncbi:hypothetical protein C1I63_08740 [Rathayibacter caricis DSM 15933]|uniref:Uncharacterized protein n=1 Tax=Rathayibacter caricis DSM 15933 TaxID=1328867 RepID=A0A2T4UTT2_9MICO|nr:hypothetical protein [Rathayibacter caricis]PTL72926.1 hypothetical protein C1I63_08740 [Rathayibacter caricis DSM 15933]